MALPALEHRFNDDLLIDRDDREYARTNYASIYHVLDHEDLRKEFREYESIANRSKQRVQCAGMLAVVLAALALLGSAITPLVGLIPHVPHWVTTALLVLEIGGIVGVFIAAGGLWLAGEKKWLKARMMAEIIRIWHFQSLIYCGSEIESSCNKADPDEPESFAAERDRRFKAFMHRWRGKLGAHLTDLIEKPTEGYQLLHEDVSTYTVSSTIIEMIFTAYREMRFEHQASYATHKLQKSTSHVLNVLKWPAAVLQSRLQGCAVAFLLLSLGCSFVIVAGHLTHWEPSHHPGWPVAIITLLILNVATRAIQDGLAAPEEIQRYNDYAGKIQHYSQRFGSLSNHNEKLAVMIEMERAALEELKGFLRAHHEARFVV